MKTKQDVQLEPLSHSRLSIFLQCPLKYKLSYIDGYKVPQTPAMALGSAFHGIAEKYVKELHNYKQKQSIELLHSIADEYYMGTGSRYDQDLAYLVYVFGQEFKLDLNRYYGSEVRFAIAENGECVDFDSPEAIFRGIADLLYFDGDTLEVIDFKTGRLTDDDPSQLLYYNTALRDSILQSKYKGQKWYIRQNLATQYYEFTQKQIENAFIKMQNNYTIIKSMAIEDFKPRLNSNCFNCHVAHLCEASTGMERPPNTYEEAKDIGYQIQKLENRVSNLKGFLKDWIENHNDDVQFDKDKYWTITEGGAKTIEDTTAFIQLMNDAGEDASTYLTEPKVDMRKINKLITSIPEVEDLIITKPRAGQLKLSKR